MTGLLDDDGIKSFTASLKILYTTFDLGTVILPLQCVKLVLIKVLLAYALQVRHSFLQYYELLIITNWFDFPCRNNVVEMEFPPLSHFHVYE